MRNEGPWSGQAALSISLFVSFTTARHLYTPRVYDKWGAGQGSRRRTLTLAYTCEIDSAMLVEVTPGDVIEPFSRLAGNSSSET